MKYRNKERADEMRLIIKKWQDSGLSKYSFCKQNNYSRATLNYWLTKHGYNLNSPLPKKNIPKKQSSKGTCVPVHGCSSPELFSELELEYPNGVKLRLPNDLPSDKLRTLISIY